MEHITINALNFFESCDHKNYKTWLLLYSKTSNIMLYSTIELSVFSRPDFHSFHLLMVIFYFYYVLLVKDANV